MADRRPRVAVVCGGLPRDPEHLRIVAREVDLEVFLSDWQAPHSSAAGTIDVDFPVHRFRPVLRTGRGHLAFVYPGLARALDRSRPDVVHVISEPWGLLAVQAARWVRHNRPAALAVHGCDTIWHHGSRAEQAARRLLLRYTLPAVDAWVAESRKALAVGERNGLRADCVQARIHTNPRDETLFRPFDEITRASARAALQIPDGVVAIGMVGRLVPEKGVELLLDAADQLHRSGFRARFLIAGDGPLRRKVEQHVSADVAYLGSVSHPHGVLQLLAALDVLACPSRTTSSWEDQGPRSVLEAMMCGCIPMVTPTGALPEMLDGHGALASSTDVAAVADALRSAAALSNRPGERARLVDWARGRYSAAAIGGQLVALWRGLAAGAGCPTAPARGGAR